MIKLEELKQIIKQDKIKKKGKYYARNYYNYKPNLNYNSIDRTYNKDIVDGNGNVKTITKTRNTFLYTNYAKLLINQKIDYVLSKEPTLNSNFDNYSIVEISDMLEDMALTASLDVTAWLFFYVEDNKIDWIMLPDSQIIPIKCKYGKNIEKIIRYYETYDSEKTFINVEVWSLEGVEYYKYKDNDNVCIYHHMDSHYYERTYYNNKLENEEAKNLPFIPFIPMNNNKNMENDITSVKDLLDFYNIIKSGFIDNIFKFQEALMKLRGFVGDDKFYEETQKNMIQFKMLALSDTDADAEYMAIEIPVEARSYMMAALKENIFKIGQGMDPDKIGDGNITNIVIKNRYSALDMKAEKTIKQIKLFYSKFVDCLNMFYSTAYEKDMECNKAINWNDSEIIDDCVKSTDIVSNKTIRKNHPWVIDEELEEKQIEIEKQDKIDEFNKSIIDQNSNLNNNDE